MRQVSTPARDELGADYTVMLYGPETLPALAPLLAAAPGAPAHLLSPNLPPGMEVNLTVDGRDYAAVTLARPAWFDRFGFARPMVLLPAEADPTGLRLGYVEMAMVVAHDRDTGTLRTLAAAIRSLLFLENRNTAQVQSPEGLLAELDGLRAMQQRWQTAAGGSMWT